MMLSAKTESLRLCVLYRPPNSLINDFLKEFQSYMDGIITSPGKLLLVGDFNIKFDLKSDPSTIKFTDALTSLNLKQHVTSGTHNQGDTLYHVITREDDDLLEDLQIHAPDISDHRTITLQYKIKKPQVEKQKIQYRKIKDIDMDSFKADLTKLPVLQMKCNDIDILVEAYNRDMSSLLDKHAPLVTKDVLVKKHFPWFNEDIAFEKKLKRKAEKNWLRSPSTVNLQILKDSKQRYLKSCKKAKITYYQSQLEQGQGDQKKMYKVANELLYRKKDKSLPNADSEEDLANSFISFFADKIKNITVNFQNNSVPITKTGVPKDINCLTHFKPITPKELRELIMSGNSKCCSLDPIPTSIVKECIDIVLPLLLRIVNVSLSTNLMPCCLKNAIVMPLLKKKSLDVEDFKNYRPVSNLPFLSKLIEKCVVKQLDSHMIVNDLYPCNQSAYRKGHSTETALVKIVDDLLSAIDRKRCTFLILLDQSAAFDTVNQDLMLSRLQSNFGITGNALDWLRSYFKGRGQSVAINNVLSKSRELVTGFPQGSVLGPFMYPVYTSPIFDIVSKHGLQMHMYADDTQAYFSFSVDEQNDAIEKVQNCIADVRQWMYDNHLKLNDSKTEFLVIGNKQLTRKLKGVSSIKVGNTLVNAVDEAKNIGVTIDSQLEMAKHVNAVCRTAYMHMYNIGKIRSFLTEEAAANLVNALVTSRLDYANSILFDLPDILLHKLEMVQKNAARLVLRRKKHDHVTPLLKKLHWLPVRFRIEFKINLLTFKCLHGHAPKYLTDLLCRYEPVRNLRSASKNNMLQEKCIRLQKTDRAFSVAAPKLWNELPDYLREIDKLSSFKSALKAHYFRIVFK